MASAANAHIQYLLHLADNALVLGQRNAEWCGHGPVLEEDIAMANISVDLIGQARMLYQHISTLAPTLATACAALPPEGANFGSAALREPRGGPSENCVLGGEFLRQQFEQIREGVVTAPRDAALLRLEITAMREKVRNAHPIKGDVFDVKHSRGGMVDAEFAVQYLVLSQSAQHRALVANVGNIALLQRAETAGLLPPGVGEAAAKAYRALRRVQHQARLDEAPTQVAPGTLEAERAAVLVLWEAVFHSA